MSDNQPGSSAQTGVERDDDRGRGSGVASRVDPSPPVLAFGSQNVIALLVELRRRERLAVWRCRARLAAAPWPSAGADQDLASHPPPGAPAPATDCKEQP
ncbi:MAG: hypothetical protein F2825_00380 [Actinobacteria bacterium]|nr:hypothetical protein [Actinomycetota bacterium]